MRGRVYDSSIARFITADPNIFHPFDPQNFNRYSYVMNNPLKYIDPSGFDVGFAGRDVGSSFGNGYGDRNNNNNESDGHGSNEAERIRKAHKQREANKAAAYKKKQAQIAAANAKRLRDAKIAAEKVRQEQLRQEQIARDKKEKVDARTARLVRGAAKSINMYGSYLITNPLTAPFGTAVLGLGLLANIYAERIDPSSVTKSLRSSVIDVITSSVPGGFAKDTGVDIFKETLNYYAGD